MHSLILSLSTPGVVDGGLVWERNIHESSDKLVGKQFHGLLVPMYNLCSGI